MSDSNQHSERERCGNTVHSNYITDHRCKRERGHPGDCLFGAPSAVLQDTIQTLISERDDLEEQLQAVERERDDYRFWNERVRTCEAHTQDVAAPVGDCLICNHDGLLEQLESAREALAFYADEKTWTQPTSWGGRIIDDEGPWLSDTGRRAREALGLSVASSSAEHEVASSDEGVRPGDTYPASSPDA